MKILYIAHEGHMGGATKSLLTLAELMKQKGHDVSVLVPLKNSEIEKALKERGINTITCFYSWWQVPKVSDISRAMGSSVHASPLNPTE